ncbi:EscF/YscF/HrpA family type III secretion system needle major subunit [uncultured Methylobacterium sp.]|jgi:type III secretion protein F|uniref:EscF/YscF/HrpA family type III secretion system needle major subunit n=1 Tax=uncultured Methylobacterium sp. TaxID=157278 RepID=UPI00262F5640|nr:EscF/YscF/HrpA family type III secretion system needle major subunit [uncultured Methylobacterium sp.]
MAAGTTRTGTASFYATNETTRSDYSTNLNGYDGFDLIWRQNYLQTQMKSIENDIRTIEKNSNLSDTEKMFSMQMAMNSWSAISNLRTNMLKSVSDTLKSVARNVA